MKIGSLFSGYGGLDMAAQRVFGATTAWVSDIDPGACKILAHRYPGVPNLGDITAIDWSQVEPVDIICGGSPCQDVSMAGARKGMKAGTRSGLWASMSDAIEAIRPTLVVWENVRGALSAGADSDLGPCDLGMGCEGSVPLRALGRVLGDLAELGYDAGWEVVRASDVGAPHRRERVFVLAWPADADQPRLEGRELLRERPGQRAAGPGGVESGLTLLPTPAASVANDGEGTGTWLARRERVKLTAQNGNGMGMPLTIAVQLLPTPKSTNNENRQSLDRYGPNLGMAVMDLLTGEMDANPTEAGPGEVLRSVRGETVPQTIRRTAGRYGPIRDAEDVRAVVREHETRCGQGRAPLEGAEVPRGDVSGVRDDGTAARPPHRPGPGEQQPGEPGDALRLMPPKAPLAGGPSEAAGEHEYRSDACGCAAWGKYGPAIHRWELILGRAAPPPTEPNAAGNQRLSARAVEFMMGLPDWHVTGVPGITRNQALKALGNGVVPQQAEAALWHLLNVMEKSA